MYIYLQSHVKKITCNMAQAIKSSLTYTPSPLGEGRQKEDENDRAKHVIPHLKARQRLRLEWSAPAVGRTDSSNGQN